MEGEHQLIVATEVSAHANDQGRLVPLLDAVEATHGEWPTTVLVDAGYRNEADLVTLEDRGMDGHVTLGREGRRDVAVDAVKYPATARMAAKLATAEARALRAAQVALGRAQRMDQGGARLPPVQPARTG